MNYKYSNAGLIFRLVLFASLVTITTVAIVFGAWTYAVPAFIFTLILAFKIVYFINGTHRKLSFFFEAIENEDCSLRLPEKVPDGNIKGLHQSLNRINTLISDIKVRQAHSERFFLEFMKHTSSGLIAVDSKGYIEIINNAALKLIGLPNLTHLNRLEQEQPALFQLMKNIKAGQSETLKMADGSQLLQISIQAALLRFGEKNYRIYSLHDIKVELEENELETWQKLIRIMTHEIMNSIAPITSISKTLSGFYTKGGEIVSVKDLDQKEIDNTAQGLAVMNERAEGLHSFVHNYRQLTRIPRPEFNPINLNDWLQSINLLFSSESKKRHISFSFGNTYNSSEFIGDEKLLTQVILNLLNNAMEALEGSEDKKISLNAQNHISGSLMINVKDNGRGFKPDEADKIFLPFYTTRENGSGIGLSLSRQIMRLHKGSISARSGPGSGTVFSLYF